MSRPPTTRLCISNLVGEFKPPSTIWSWVQGQNALIGSVVADVLDGNIRIAEDSTITEANVDLAALIGNALAADGAEVEAEAADTATDDSALEVGATSSFDTAYTTQAIECLVTTNDEIATA